MFEYTVMEQYWIWLSAIDGVGPKKFYQLLSRFEDARTVWEACPDADLRFVGEIAAGNIRKARNERFFFELFARLENAGVRAVTRISDGYPQRLTQIYDPPPTLYVRGNANLNPERAAAIIGSRRCSSDGRRAALEFAEKLAREDVTVISGLARGIDSCAHKGALASGGATIAVLGCGPDIVYPPENAGLVDEILEKNGALVSEYLPGMPPVSTNFPARNRIISGMSDAVLLVEGTVKSGAMITVNFALEQSREVFAIPGSIYSPLSKAPNELIGSGAALAASPWDVLEVMKWAQRPSRSASVEKRPELSEAEAAVAEPLYIEALSKTELENITGMNVTELNYHLTTLLLRGIIREQPGGRYRAYK